MFSADIEKFNRMYKMPVSTIPTLDVGVPLLKRLTDFKSILGKELDEMNDIINKVVYLQNGQLWPSASSEGHIPVELEIMTDLADLLGDLQVYCASEMAKFGLPQDEVLSIIMRSNFSKMGADGKPEYDDEGKLQKGPDYWKPEPMIEALLQAKLLAVEGHKAADALLAHDNKVRADFEKSRKDEWAKMLNSKSNVLTGD